jgi:hypothetical protein
VLGDAFRSAGGSEENALEVINAYAVRHENENMLLVSPSRTFWLIVQRPSLICTLTCSQNGVSSQSMPIN